MATIRTQQMAPVNYGDSNQLLREAQRMILGAGTGLADTFGQYRQNVVDRNTAAAVNALTGAQNLQDLATRQKQARNIVSASQGDINNEAVQRAQLTMPDTLLNRQNAQNRLTEFTQQQHDLPLLNQAMSLFAAGDQEGASKVLSGVQGDATKALTFGANRADQAFTQNLQNQQLGIQQAGLALRKEAAKQRADAITNSTKGNAQMQGILKQLLGNNAEALQASTTAAVKERNQQLTEAERNNPLNNPKSNLRAAIGEINDQSWFVNRGNKLNTLVNQLDPEGNLTDAQRVNLLQGMNTAFEQNNGWLSSANPDKAALDWGKEAIDKLQSARKGRLENTQAQIDQKRATQNARLQVLLSALQGNGSLNPMALQLLNTDDEE